MNLHDRTMPAFCIYSFISFFLARENRLKSLNAIFFSGNDLVERFHDQFTPMRVTQEASLSSANSTVIRMPLSSKCLKELEAGCNRVKHIFDRFTQNPSSTLLFLRSIIQVIIVFENHYCVLGSTLSGLCLCG